MENKIIEKKSHKLSLENEEYELTMNLGESYIEFKLVPKNKISDFCYKAEFDLSSINKYLFSKFPELKRAFDIYDKQLNNKKVKLIKLKEDSINLNLIRINDFEEEVETNLELKRYEIKENDAYPLFLNRLNELNNKILELEKNLNEMKKEKLENKGNEENKKIESLIEDYLTKKKIEEEMKKQKEEELLREEEEKKIKLNDNINLSNDFQCDNINNLKEFDYLPNSKIELRNKSLAVYSIIRNNKRFYELACAKRGRYDKDRGYYYYHIVIYNILLNNISNKIHEAHFDQINNIKHYYYSSANKHFLLSSNQKSIYLWNISSNAITKELSIDNNYNDCSRGNNYPTYYCNCSCLLFKNENYVIFSGYSAQNKTSIFNKDGNQIETIKDSNLVNVNYIEATYIENKPYVLLAGNNCVESYDYDSGYLNTYKPKGKESSSYAANLFKKNEKIYLICGQGDGRVIIFDFISTEEIDSIKIGNSNTIYGLCSLNEKYYLVGDDKEIKVIDFDDKKIIKKYKDISNEQILGIEKIKVPEKGELIISYTENIIALWK